MSCNSCKKFGETNISKNNKTNEDYMNEIYNIYDDNYTTLINQSESELYLKQQESDLYLNKSEYSFNLPKYILNNEDSIFGTEVYKYLNFTNLQNTDNILNDIQNDMNISSNIFIDDSICSNSMAKAGNNNEIENSLNCSDKILINTGVTYWINGISKQIINPEFLIPNIFRKCQYNTLACPTQELESTNNSLSKLQSLTYNRPKLIDGDTIMALLYKGIITESSVLKSNNYSKNEPYNIKIEYLSNIFLLLNFNYDNSLNWTILNILRYYNRSLLFQLINFINICFNSNKYYNKGKVSCNYIVPWTATVVCYADNRNNGICYKNQYYSEFPLTFEQLKIIYDTTIINKNIIYFINNNLPFENSSNYFSIILYYALRVFKDVILEMKYNISPYNSIQHNKYFCKKSYMNIKSDKNGSDKDKRLYNQLLKYACASKQQCIPINPVLYKYICVQIYDFISFTNEKGITSLINGPTLYNIVNNDELNRFSESVYSKSNIQGCKPSLDIIDIKVINAPSFYNSFEKSGFGPLLINENYNISISLKDSTKRKYRLMYLLWNKQEKKSEDCYCNGCSSEFPKGMALVPKTTTINGNIIYPNCNCTFSNNKADSSPNLLNGPSRLDMSINNLQDNYCLYVFIYKYVESFYIEDKYTNNQIKNLSLTKTFDLGLWGNNFTYSTNRSSITDKINYANTLGLDEQESVTKTSDNLSICFNKDIDSFEVPVNQNITQFNLNAKSDKSNNIIGFTVYSVYSPRGIVPQYKLCFSQLFYKNSKGEPIFTDINKTINGSKTANNFGGEFNNIVKIIPSGVLTGCDDSDYIFLEKYLKDKIYYINMMTYIPFYSWLPISNTSSLINNTPSNLISDLIENSDDIIDQNTQQITKQSTQQSTQQNNVGSSINPDIYIINSNTSSSNPNDWFLLDPVKGTIYNKNNSNTEIQYDFDYLWFPPMDLLLGPLEETNSNQSVIELPKSFDEAKGIDLDNNNIYYDDFSITDLNNKGFNYPDNKNLFFSLNNPININTYYKEGIIKRTKGTKYNSMSYHIIEKSIKGINKQPFIIKKENNIFVKSEIDPSIYFSYSLGSNIIASERTIKSNNSLSDIKSSGLYFNTDNDNKFIKSDVYKNDISLNLNDNFTINSPLYYQPSIDITLADTTKSEFKGTFLQPYSNTTLPYKYQIDYYKNQKKYTNFDNIIYKADINYIPPKFNYVLPIYEQNTNYTLKYGFYTSSLYNIGFIPNDNDITTQILAPVKKIIKSGDVIPVNMTLLYNILDKSQINELADKGLYSWGQYSKADLSREFNSESYNPVFRYSTNNKSDHSTSYKGFQDQFELFKKNNYHLECSNPNYDLSKAHSSLNEIKLLTSKYSNTRYLSISTTIDELDQTITDSNPNPDIYACLILYPIIQIIPSIGNTILDYKFNKGNNLFNIELSATQNSSISSNFTREYLISKADNSSTNQLLNYINTKSNTKSLFGLVSYDNAIFKSDNYFPYDKGTYSFTLEADIRVNEKSIKSINNTTPFKSFTSMGLSNENEYMYEPIITKGFNQITKKYNTIKKEKADNNSTYQYTKYSNTEDITNISGPSEFRLNFSYITFLKIPINNNNKNISVNLYQGNDTIGIKADFQHYYGIVPNNDLKIKTSIISSQFSGSAIKLYKADKGEWNINNISLATEINEGKIEIKNIEYDSYIDIKLLGELININTNNISKNNYPLDFILNYNSQVIKSSDFIKEYDISPLKCNTIDNNINWSRYTINKNEDIKNCNNDRENIGSGYLLQIQTPNKNNTFSSTCLPSSDDIINGYDTSSLFTSTELSGDIIKGINTKSYTGNLSFTGNNYNLYKNSPISSENNTPEYSIITSKEVMDIYVQYNTIQKNLYNNSITLKGDNKNKTFGRRMSISNNMLITGTPPNELIKGSTKSDASGLINIYDLGNLSDVNDNIFISKSNYFMLDCVSHYSIYGINFQSSVFFSTDETKGNLKQYVKQYGFLIEDMEDTKSINEYYDNVNSNIYTGFSLDLFESVTEKYELYGVIGSIPKRYIKGGSLSFVNNGYIMFSLHKYDFKSSKSNIDLLAKQDIFVSNFIPFAGSKNEFTDFDLPQYDFDLLGYKVKAIYTNVYNETLIMCINRLSYTSKNNKINSHALLLKYKPTSEPNNEYKVNIEDYIELTNYEIIDATASISEGVVNEDERIIMYLTVKEIDESSFDINSYKYYIDSINPNDYINDNINKIIKVEFVYSSTDNLYHISDKLKLLNSISKSSNNPYYEKGDIYYQKNSFLFGSSLDSVSANMLLPDSNGDINISCPKYRTNFLLINNKTCSNKGECSNKGNDIQNIISSATIYCDKVIEECNITKNENSCTSNGVITKFGDFYNNIYSGEKGNNNAISNIELFSFEDLNDSSNENNYSNLCYSTSIDITEALNECYLELPDRIAIFNMTDTPTINIYSLNQPTLNQ